MKRFSLLLVVIMAMGLFSNVNAQRAIKNGMSINAIVGFPSESYGAEEAIESDYTLGTLWGLQLGNRWYFSPTEQFGVGLMANWFDFTIGTKSGTEGGGDWSRAVLDISFLEVGPVGTYALNSDMAIDGYYNLRPTVLSSAFVTSSLTDSDETFAYVGFGFSHAIGAAFRWKVLNVGIEYVTGGIKSTGSYTGSLTGVDLEDSKNKTNSVRLLLGVKF